MYVRRSIKHFYRITVKTGTTSPIEFVPFISVFFFFFNWIFGHRYLNKSQSFKMFPNLFENENKYVQNPNVIHIMQTKLTSGKSIRI